MEGFTRANPSIFLEERCGGITVLRIGKTEYGIYVSRYNGSGPYVYEISRKSNCGVFSKILCFTRAEEKRFPKIPAIVATVLVHKANNL